VARTRDRACDPLPTGRTVAASLHAALQSQPLVGLGLFSFSGTPLLLAAWAEGWAEEEPPAPA
jgi:hypothetical protein